MANKKTKTDTTAAVDNTTPIADYITANRDRVCRVFDSLLRELESEERIKSAPLNQLVSTLGTLIDKFGESETKDEEKSGGLLADILKNYSDII